MNAVRKLSVDVAVIGTGPGGEGAAMMAAKNHLSTVVIDRYVDVGGGCTHWGTIPSKALRYSVKQLNEAKNNRFVRHLRKEIQISYPQLLESAVTVIESQVASRHRAYERNHVPIIEGEASFVDPHTVQVRKLDSVTHEIEAKHFLIATGSRPYHPEGLDFSHPRILDSDSVLKYRENPRSITIYGAGVIGCEYASIFANLGIKVNLVNTQNRLLSFMDEEITEALSYHLRDQGVIIRHNEEFSHVEARERDVVLHLKSGRKLKSDALLWANGRTGNSDSLNLPALGLSANSRGQLSVNENFQTEVPHIYAVGDIIGYPALASSAYDQGRFALTHILNPEERNPFTGLMPTGIYTIPEISSVGKTEQELAAEGVTYEVGYSYFKHLARAQMSGEMTGMLKLIFDVETRKVLGIHCFGDRSAEIVHIGQAVMAHEDGNLNYFINTTFNYPTMAEAYRVAALNGMNRIA
nr:Si-specific NAD(P)(+) transhydrogenase [Oceanococcus sp. HetDA_MAG_MS8]